MLLLSVCGMIRYLPLEIGLSKSGVALPQYAQQTVEKQGLDIDVITGCTVSLDGYKEAVNDALATAVN